MKIKEGSIIVTKEGEYVLKKMINTYSTFSLEKNMIFIVEDSGKEKRISEKDVLFVKNNDD